MGSQTWSVSHQMLKMMNRHSSFLLLFSSSLIVCNGQLVSNTNQLVNQVNGIAQGMVALNARIISARSMITNQGVANDVRAVSDYYLGSGDKCGPQTITGWSQNVDYARTQDTLETGTRFDSSTGIYTPIIAGYYHVCAYARFKNGGNAVEMCLRKGSTRIACFGNAVQYGWRSTGVCTNQQVTSTADTFSLYLESGGSSDCLQETSWRYARISVQLIQQTATAKL